MNIDYISQNWPLTNPTIELLKKSGERTVYKVIADEGTFIFKIADPSKSEATVLKDTQILRFFEEVNYPAPQLLLSRSGTNYVLHEGKCVYAISYLEGNEPENNKENYAKLGEVMARLHSLQGYTIPTDFTAEVEIPTMLARAKKFNMDAHYIELVKALPDFSRFPTCLIHTDIGSHNSIQLTTGEIVLVDWDDAGIGTRILDLGFPLICDFVTKDLRFEKDRAEAFYKAYCSIITLTDEEKAHLFDAGLFYALSYTIFDDSGIVEGQWRKVLWAIEHKNEILSALPPNERKIISNER
ncbi:MAG TPA: phosphotransferase [Candidatus Saccharimonadales bacterium]|nr:phosphotransferase [Candidatus Saccharimonadales bacterium]